MATSMKRQRGGFGLGMVVGLLVGLAVALAVALYVTKAPVPFVDKVPQRTQEQDAAETERNRNWDPNAPLYGKNPARAPAGVASGVVQSGAAQPPAAAPAPAATPSAVVAAPRPAAAASAASSAARSGSAEGTQFYVQVGAYTRTEDAEQQRAKLAISGLTARITEREQSGRIIYRVRLGPFDTQSDAEKAKEEAAGAGYGESALVRVAK
ncbi:sporulation related protein [Sphaerotilus hippei]|uniref:Sporulation related protein n=1 Tax=Sphaerotilus hippei TaxID=744406 RepID=A0A318H5N1_9BURK|nr:SPOR domain-containing protein [Sphaerotilus hippei]PXW99254.1 sporulation related protein [Sphaerotilus hippei]